MKLNYLEYFYKFVFLTNLRKRAEIKAINN